MCNFLGESSRANGLFKIGGNSTLPVQISSIRVLHANHTRRGFLADVFRPLLNPDKNNTYTLSEALQEVSGAAQKLDGFDIFQPPISVFVDSIEAPTTPNAPTALSVFLSAREKSRYTI